LNADFKSSEKVAKKFLQQNISEKVKEFCGFSPLVFFAIFVTDSIYSVFFVTHLELLRKKKDFEVLFAHFANFEANGHNTKQKRPFEKRSNLFLPFVYL
jgi:hypothetical protein